MEKTNIFGLDTKSSNKKHNLEELKKLLTELNNVLCEKNSVVTLNVYGGFVMCMYSMRFMTEDIDAVYIQSEKLVDDAVRIVSRKCNVKENWLNSAIKEIVLEDMIKEDLLVLTLDLSNLVINIPSGRQMLAMKLYSARIDKDLVDAVNLAQSLGISTATQLDKVVKEYFDTSKVILRNRSNKTS